MTATAQPAPEQAQGPLAGVRLIELDAIGPVPLAGMILSGLGAEIVRIGRPGVGAFGDVGAAILHRSRIHVGLDLKRPRDRAALLDLVGHADALIEGYRPGVMERLGIGPDTCLARNPALVFARVTGWGQEGPLARTAGHDINYIAMTGALHAIGGRDAPVVPLNLIGDYAGGTMFAALGIVSAILSARTTGRGQVIDVAMVDGVATLLAMFHAYLSTGQWRDERAANMLDGGTPYYRCYACADGGHIAVGALEPQFFAALLGGLELDPARFVQTDEAGWPAMAAEFARLFASRPRSHWEQVFAGTDACVAPVLSLSEAMTHPANTARDMFFAHAGVPQTRPAPRFSDTPGSVRESCDMSVADAIDRWR